MWSGGLKAAAGGLSAIGNIFTVAGAAPVGAAITGVTGGISIGKFAFEKGYKYFMRRDAVGKELNINWSDEKAAVRAMVKMYNPDLGITDREARAIILKAHGSNARTRDEAYDLMKAERAEYLLDLAKKPGPYQQTAQTIIKALGVYGMSTDNNGNVSFKAGAEKILAEKMGI